MCVRQNTQKRHMTFEYHVPKGKDSIAYFARRMGNRHLIKVASFLGSLFKTWSKDKNNIVDNAIVNNSNISGIGFANTVKNTQLYPKLALTQLYPI